VAETSLVPSPKALREDGTASLIVEDEDMVGRSAFLVFMDTNGSLLTQFEMKVGEVFG
jgi:hypothetical protein